MYFGGAIVTENVGSTGIKRYHACCSVQYVMSQIYSHVLVISLRHIGLSTIWEIC